MRYGDEQAQVAEWLYGLLSTDPVLAGLAGVALADLPDRVWPDVAPGGTPAPWLVYSVGEALDTDAVGPGPRLMTTVPVNVRWVTQDDGPDTGPAAARHLYAVLQGSHNAPVSDGGMVLTCRRTTALSYPEDAGGIQYRHTGGLYAVQVN